MLGSRPTRHGTREAWKNVRIEVLESLQEAGLVDAHPLVPGFLAGMYADVDAATTVLLRSNIESAVAWNAVIAAATAPGWAWPSARA